MFQALRRVYVAVSDFARSRRFYGETLGLPEEGSFEADWVEFGPGPILLKLAPLRPGEVSSRNQVAIVLSTSALEASLTTLKERGVTVTRGPVEEFTGRSAEILDPDGYRIILFQPSDLHPDEEWVPASRIDESVRQKLALIRQREKARSQGATKGVGRFSGRPAPKPAPKVAKKPAPKKPAPKKSAPKKPAPGRPAPKRPAPKKPTPKKPTPKKPTPKKPAPKKPTPKKPTPKKPARRR